MLRTELIEPIAVLLRRHAEQRGSKIAYQDSRRAVSYAKLLERTGNLAGHLVDGGLEPGQCVALMLPNSVDWVEVCFAIVRAGGVCVPISYDAAEGEVAYRLQDADCRIVVTSGERARLIEKVKGSVPNLRQIIVTSDRAGEGHAALEPLCAEGSRAQPRDATDIDTPSFIIYTSGTTGRAKGVLLTVRGMLWVTAACWSPICGLSESDVVLSPLPLFHSYALNLSVLAVVAVGATEHILEKFSTGEVLTLLQTGKYTLLPGVPTMFHYLLQRAKEVASTPAPRTLFGRQKAQPEAGKLPGVRMCISAGAIMPATLNKEFEEHFHVPLLDGYGITETSTMVTMNWPTGGRIMGSCGIPVPGLSVRIVDPANGRDQPAGKEGELIVRGPNVMPGYHNKPGETEAALRDGWYRTGDLACSDANGFLTITGRLKELIIRGGQNIAPAEIEEAVNKFPAILDCAVVGIPHAQLGEVPALFVVPRPQQTIDAEALKAHCASLLSAYKVPHDIHVVGEIPRTGSGKIIRFKLKEQLTGKSA